MKYFHKWLSLILMMLTYTFAAPAHATIYQDPRVQYLDFQKLLSPYLTAHPEYGLGNSTPIPASELSNAFVKFNGGFMTSSDMGFSNVALHTGDSWPVSLETTQIRMDFSKPIEEGMLNLFVSPDYPDPSYYSQMYTFLAVSQPPRVSVDLFDVNGGKISSYETLFTSPMELGAGIPLKANEQFASLLLTFTDGLGLIRTGQNTDCSIGPIPSCVYYDQEFGLTGHLTDLAYIPGVPEPGTYLLILMGLGLLGFMRKELCLISLLPVRNCTS